MRSILFDEEKIVHQTGGSPLHKGLPICAMTCGLGHFGSASISSLAKDLRIALTRDGSDLRLDSQNYTIEEVCEKARRFLHERYQAIDPPPAVPHSFEFWIGGYGSNGCQGEIRKIVFA
ncbi:MAG: hypothetical protein ACK4UZ_08825, partial [Rhizobium rhizophilum]